VRGTPAHRLIDAAFAGDYKTVGAILKEVLRRVRACMLLCVCVCFRDVEL
jgi:hypothetical protein